MSAACATFPSDAARVASARAARKLSRACWNCSFRSEAEARASRWACELGSAGLAVGGAVGRSGSRSSTGGIPNGRVGSFWYQ